MTIGINDREFSQFQSLLYDIAGISLSDAKKPLVVSRLAKRLREHQLSSYGDYFKLLRSEEHPHELQTAIDLLTTNETYFFRESTHFDFLRQQAEKSKLTGGGKSFRIWSAASSSGQEAYSMAMVLDDVLGTRPWEILASDISTSILEKARQALYPIAQAEQIPKPYLSRYCLKGVGAQEGSFLIDKPLRARVNFFQANLNKDLPRIGEFDVIFLRNVMIYFDLDTKREVVSRLQARLQRGGYLVVGHSESLNGVNNELQVMSPSIYRKT